MATTAAHRSPEQKIFDAITLLKLDVHNVTYLTLKQAYRDMALAYHPDKNRGNAAAELLFQEINESNQLLKQDLDNGAYYIRRVAANAKMQEQDLSRKVNKVPITYDGLEPKTKPYVHQVIAFNRFRDSEFFALFMDMGTGKTKTIIDIASYKYINNEIDAILVVAPNHVHTQWVNEQYPEHCSIPYEAFVWEQRRWNHQRYRNEYDKFTFEKSNCLKVFAMNVEAYQGKPGVQFTNYFLKNNRTFMVLDESTRIKAPEAKRSIAIRQFSDMASCRAILTGTPTAKSPLDIWSPFNFLQDNYFGMDWMKFRSRYSVMIMDQGSRRKRTINDYEFERVKRAIQHWQGDGDMYDCLSDVAEQLGMSFRDVRYLNEQEQQSKYKDENVLRELIGKDTFAIKKEDCLDLPPKVYEIIKLDMAQDQRKAYNQLKASWAAAVKLENGQVAELEVTAMLAVLRRFMQICGGFFPEKPYKDAPTTLHPFKTNVKLEALVEDISENCHDKQAIIWSEHQHEIRLIKQRLIDEGYTAQTYYGLDSKEKKERTVAQFKSGEIQFLIANPTVAGYGLNFQNCSVQYFFCNTYRTEARIQAEDRTHRSGQEQTCVYKDIIIKDSIDERIFAIIKEGKALNDVFKTIEDVEDAL